MNPDGADQRAVALWGADCTEHMLQFLKELRSPATPRPPRIPEYVWQHGRLAEHLRPPAPS
jgi:hypothetical protein